MLKKLIIPGVVGLAAVTGVGVSAAVSGVSAVNAATATPPTSTSSNRTPQTPPDFDSSKGGHIGPNGTKEEVLTGDTKAKAEAAATAAESGATIIRAETDAEGAKYEVHMKKADGSLVTVKLDENFKVTATEDGMGPGPQGPNAPAQSSN